MTTLRKQILDLKSQPTLENLRIMVFTEIIKEYGIKSADLSLFARVVCQLEGTTFIELGEDIEDINLEDGKEN